MPSLQLLGLCVAALLALSACAPKQPASPTHPVAHHPEMAGKRVVYREEVKPPSPAPPFRLVDRTGEALSLEDLRGKVVALSFIYTSCPDVCPLLARNFLDVQKELGDLVGTQVALAFITTDFVRDTPERLQQYTRALGGRWHFLTGPKELLEQAWKEYRIYVEVNPQGTVLHSYKTYLLDREGRVHFLYGGIYDPAELVADIHILLH